MKIINRILFLILINFLYLNPIYAVDWGDPGDTYPWGRPPSAGVEVATGAFYMTLGPTGIRAKYIDQSRNTMVVTYVFPTSPAAGLIKKNDVITGTFGQDFQTVAYKSGEEGNDGGYGGPFKEFGEAIEKAQDSDGVIPITVLRKGDTLNQNVTINVTGTFSSTYPYNCPKSTAVYPKLLDYIISEYDTGVGYWKGMSGDGMFYASMAVMSSTDPQYYDFQTTRAHDYADKTHGTLQEWETGSSTWFYGFTGIYLCEYYLRFKDDPAKDVEWVVVELEQIRDWLYDARYQRQHHPQWATPDGWGHRHQVHLAGYGAFMYPTPLALTALGMIKRCGIDVDREYIDSPMAVMRHATNDTGLLWYMGNSPQPDGELGDRARSSMAAMANYFAPTHDTLYVDYAKHYAGINTIHVGPNMAYLNGHGSNLIHQFSIATGQRLNPTLQRKTLDEFKTWYALCETEVDGQFVTQPTRGSVSSGGRARTAGSALLALLIAQPTKSLHIYGAGSGNGEPITFNVPLIYGNPSLSIAEGAAYNFAPTATDADGDTLIFSIENKPTWAKFNKATGELSGTPNHNEAGDNSNIVISVSDGVYTSELPQFAITVLDTPIATNSKVKVFILAGQSNMEGKGTVKNKSTTNWNGLLETLIVSDPAKYGHLVNNGDIGSLTSRTDVYVAYKRFTDQPQIATGGLAAKYGASGGTIGPELGMGEKVGDQLTEKVLIIKMPIGGTAINVGWRPPSASGDTGILYTRMVTEVNGILNDIGTYVPGYAGEGYEISGFGWWQGWNNVMSNNPTTKKEYEDMMVLLGNDVRTSFNAPSMPIVVVSSGNGGYDPNMPGACVALRDIIEPAQEAAAARLSNASYYSTRDLWNDAPANAPYTDWSHWNYSFASYYDIGRRLGDNFNTLRGNGLVPVNHSPFISGSPVTNFEPDSVTAYSFIPTVTDADNDTITYSIESKPDWATFNELTGELSGVPTPAHVGIYPVTITATDGLFSTSMSFDLNISGASGNVIDFSDHATNGQLPTAGNWDSIHVLSGTNTDTVTLTGKNNIRIPMPITITANTILEFDFESIEKQNYHLIGLRDGSNTNHWLMVYGIKATRPNDYDVPTRYKGPGKEHFRVELGTLLPLGNYTDLAFNQLNGATMNSIFSRVSIYELDQVANQPPVFTNAPQASFVADGVSVYSYTPTATDYEVDPLTFTTVGVPSWATYNAATGGFEGVPTLADAGSYPMTFSVSDGTVTTVMQSTITITSGGGTPNYPPVIQGTPTSPFEADGSTYSFIPQAADANPGDTLTFSITNKPSWASFNTATGEISGVPTSNDVGTSAITITVSDGLLSAQLAFDLTITIPGVATAINFDNYTVNGELPHHASRTGTQTINGTTATFTGKMDGQVTTPITVTANTVLEFDFSSTVLQKRHWIGLNGEAFYIAGTSNARSGDYVLPAYTGGTQHYSVNLSDFIAVGSYAKLFIMQLGSSDTADGTWSNVKIHESTQ